MEKEKLLKQKQKEQFILNMELKNLKNEFLKSYFQYNKYSSKASRIDTKYNTAHFSTDIGDTSMPWVIRKLTIAGKDVNAGNASQKYYEYSSLASSEYNKKEDLKEKIKSKKIELKEIKNQIKTIKKSIANKIEEETF